jgi:hypothetical protein
VEAALHDAKGLVFNSAGIQGALMPDIGFSPDAAVAFCAICFIVPLLAQHAFVRERHAARAPRGRASTVKKTGGT